MQQINFCKKCLNPSTRPNTYFNEKGYCYVCVYEKNKKIDFKTNRSLWERREREIKRICRWAKKNTKSSYDCIIPVSGGKDSYRQSFYARDKLGLNPLLVSNNYPPEQWTDIGAYNLQNLVNHGFDLINISLDPVFWKKLYKHCFKVHGNMMKASEMALYSAPVHVALEFEIPLMFYGENPAHTIGERHGSLTGDASGIKYGNTIKGGPSTLKYKGNDKSDFYFYEYPSNNSLVKSDIKIVYLGYYIRDWYGYVNGKEALKKGFLKRTDKPINTGDLWGFTGVDDDIRLVNQYLKYLKYGYGHVVDQVCEAINQNFMTRKEGIRLINKFDGKCSEKYIKNFCKYAEISLNEFWLYVDKIVNKNLFTKKNGKWTKNFKVV